MVKCSRIQKRIIVQIATPPGNIEPVPYASIRYGKKINVAQETIKAGATGKAEFCYLRGINPYISIQKTDYIFSDRPIFKKPEHMSWGASSDWFKVTGLYKTIFSLKKPIVDVDEILEKVCTAWKTVADPQVPLELATYFTASLPISINNAVWECPNLNTTENINGVKALVKINRSVVAKIPITNGYGSSVDLGRLPAFTSVLKSLTSRGASIIPIEISIPNKGIGDTSFTFDVAIPRPEIPRPETRIPDIEQICVLGDRKTARCTDGTEIITHVCEQDRTTGINQWMPTGRPCPQPQLGKTARILTSVEGDLRAYDGMDVTIAASVMCGASPSNNEPAFLIIDGEQIASKKTTQGFVTFTWRATTEPTRTHRIVVRIPKSDQCPAHGEASDSKTITVSNVIPGIEEQLKLERDEYKSQLGLLREERKRIRELSTTAPVTAIFKPPVISPITPPFEPPVTPPLEPPVEPPETQPGIINIPSIPTPPMTEYPINVFIDGVLKGQPPIELEVSAGTHNIKVELKNFTPLNKKVNIIEGQTLIITDMEFLQ